MCDQSYQTLSGYPEPKNVRCDAIPDEEIAKALWATKGLQATAALRLGCRPTTLSERIQQSPYLQAVRADAREIRIDRAELALADKIEAKDTTSIIFALKTIGKHRGYSQEEHRVVSLDELGEALIRVKNTSKELVNDSNSSE